MADSTIVSQPTRPSRNRILIIGCAAALVLGCLGAAAVGAFFLLRDRLGGEQEPAVAYILDTSPRMSDAAEQGTRLSVAQAILAEIVRPADPELTSGLRVFGSGALTESCEDTELLVPFAPANQSTIADELMGIAVGGSPESALAQAMIDAIRDLDAADGPHFMVVVTGGEDSCNPQAGELIAGEAERANIELQTFVVGFRVSEASAQALKTMSDQLEGGSYHEAQNEAALREVLGTIQERIDRTAAAGRLGEPAAVAPAGDETTDGPKGGDGAPSNGYDSQTACDHPYFPLRAGATWTYSGAGGSLTWRVASVSGDLSSATASMIMDIAGASINYEWTCGSEGIFHYQFASFAFDEAGGVFNFELQSQSGAPLLPPGGFLPGASWTSAYTYVTEVGAEGFTILTTVEVEQSHTAGEVQEMTTGLGTFEVIPLTTEGTSTSSTAGVGAFSSSWTSICMMAYGVGWIRCETVTEEGTEVMELVSYSIPEG